MLVHVTTTDISLELLLGPQLVAFRDAGYEVVTASAPGPFVSGIEAMGVRHVSLSHATRAVAPHRDAAALIELRSLFRSLRPDIVHTHNPKPGVYGRIAARSARVPCIVNTVHGLYALPEDSVVKRAVVYGLERLAAACSDAELVQSAEDLDTLSWIGVPRAKLQLLGNGIDLARFDPTTVSPERREAVRAGLGAGLDDVVVGAVGRLVREKGYQELLAAWPKVKAAYPGARLMIIGPADPDKADALPARAIDAAGADGVIFLGMRDDVVDLYAAMDVYVLASYREGFPRSAMEAAAMGLPVVATNIRGCREVVEDGATGTLVPPRDPAALGDAISALVGDAEARWAMGTAGRKKAARQFDQRRVIDITLATYDRLLSRPGART